MNKIYSTLLKRNFTFRERAEYIFSLSSSYPSWRRRYLASSLIADAWQTWCNFCCETILSSCRGTVTRSGTYVAPRPSDNSRKRVAYEINQSKSGRRIKPAKQVNFLRQEPTWGDVDVLITALPYISPANERNLVTGFGVNLPGVKHMQIIRNACAHVNAETVLEAKALLPQYTGSYFNAPIDIFWWEHSRKKTYAFYSWLDDQETIARLVTH